jgi:dipeptidyl aminopeptidase/acylaminoacyl peptidase
VSHSKRWLLFSKEEYQARLTAAKGRMLERYKDYVQVEDPQLSPDGKYVIYALTSFDSNEYWQTEVQLIRLEDRREQTIGLGSNARWSPDSSSFLYLASDDKDKTQLFLYKLESGSSRQLSNLNHAPSTPTWSPDGKQIAFCNFVPEAEDWLIELPPSTANVVRSPEPFITTDLHYKQEPASLLERGFDHLFLLSVETGKIQQLTSGRWNAGARETGRVNPLSRGVSWTPDGQYIFFDSNKRDDADLRWLESHIYKVAIKDSSITQLTQASQGETTAWYNPQVSPDGKFIVFQGYTWKKKHHFLSQSLWLMTTEGEDLRNLTPMLDSVPYNVCWHPESKGLYFNVPQQGRVQLCYVSLEGELEHLHTGDDYCLELSNMSKAGEAVGRIASQTQPDELAHFLIAKPAPRRLTEANKTMLENVKLGSVEELDYRSSDGTPIKGWLHLPPDFNSAQRYPLIVRPDAATPYFNYELHNYAANGYVVFTCHYRLNQASVGFGEAYTNDGFNGYPNERIYSDILSGIDAVIAKGYIDPKKLFVVGSSQGGTVTAGLIGYTKRFAAAAVLRPGWIDAMSGTLTTDETLWSFHTYQTPFWENPEQWLKHSPLMSVHHINTPTLLMTGEADWRTPMNQTEQFYAALKIAGKAPTRLIRMPGANHGWGDDVATFARLQLYVLKWFDEWEKR